MSKQSLTKENDGVGRYEVASFAHLSKVVQNIRKATRAPVRPDQRTYIYRGQWENSDWKLEPRLDRYARKRDRETVAFFRLEAVERFQRAARGRVRIPISDTAKSVEWWELGQHYGLATPLLDWTLSPYVALFFAFCEPEGKPRQRRVVHAFQRYALDATYRPSAPGSGDQSFRVVDPLVSRNERLVAQQGLFTLASPGRDIEGLVLDAYKGSSDMPLIKIVFAQGVKRDDTLKRLDSMNVNYRTLFPDLTGVTMHCNLALEIQGY